LTSTPISTAGRQRLKVILDTNAFFVPLQFRISLPNELEHVLRRNFEMVLVSPVKRELVTLAKKRPPSIRKDAEYALKLAEECTYIDMESSPPVPADDAIVRAAKDWKAVVFTNDRQLRKRLKDISVPVIYVRQKSRLEIDGMI
jgi:rRNA-processing protein FCF1